MPAVDIKRPLKVAKEENEVTVVKNIGTPTVYYRTGQNAESVSSSLNDGSLASAKSLTLSQTTCFIATEGGAQVEINAYPSAGQTGDSSPESNAGSVANVNTFGASTIASPAANGKAIQAAIESLGKKGGVVLFPERGNYEWEGELVCESRENVILKGQGGMTGGGGMGTGTAVRAGTNLLYVGESATITTVINARKTVGFSLEHIYLYCVSKKLAEKEGTFLNLEGSVMAGGYEFGLEASGPAGVVYNGVTGIFLGGAIATNVATFNRFRISGFANGIIGKVENTHESVGHSFFNGFFVGNQSAHILNPDQAWLFVDCIFEELRNEATAKIGAGTVKLLAGRTCNGLTFIGGWMGGAKEEVGTQIEFSGNGLTILGTEINCAKVGIELKGKSANVTFNGPCQILTKGLVIPAGAKESTNIKWEPTRLTEVTTSSEGEANALLGSTFTPKTVPVVAWKEVKAPAGETTAELKATIKEITEVLKGAGLVK